MTVEEIRSEYEKETDNVIIVTFAGKSADDIPAALVHFHGPFTWGTDPYNTVHNVVVMEVLAFMVFHTEAITPSKEAMQQELWTSTICASTVIIPVTDKINTAYKWNKNRLNFD